MIGLSIYVIGAVVFAYCFGRWMRDFDYPDLAFFAIIWPFFVPLGCLVWLLSRIAKIGDPHA